MIYFTPQTTHSQNTQDCKEIIINPYSYNLEDLENQLSEMCYNNQLSESDNNINMLQKNNIYTNQLDNSQQVQILLEIDKFKYRIDGVKRLQQLQDIFKRNHFIYQLRLVLNGEQAIQEQEWQIFNKILSTKQYFDYVEIQINQNSNQQDWDLVRLLYNKQIGVLILKLDKLCEQTLRNLEIETKSIRILDKVKIFLNDDIPKKVFSLFEWPEHIELEIQENVQTVSNFKMKFLKELKFVNHLEINYIDNSDFQSQNILLSIFLSQFNKIEKIHKLTFNYQESFSSHLNEQLIQQNVNLKITDFSLFQPFERFLPGSLKKEKLLAEQELFRSISKRNLIDITLSITVNQIPQFLELFQRQVTFTKLHINLNTYQYNQAYDKATNEQDIQNKLIDTLKNIPFETVSIENLSIISQKSLSYRFKKSYYDTFSLVCIHILRSKVTKLSLQIQSILENHLEMLATNINKNTCIEILDLQFYSKVNFNNKIISDFAESNIQSMSCCVNKYSFNFFNTLFLNAKNLKILYLKIDQVKAINTQIFKLTIPYIYLHVSQQISYQQKMILFKNKNIYFFFNSADQSKTMFALLYSESIQQLLKLNAIYNKFTNPSDKRVFLMSFLDMLEQKQTFSSKYQSTNSNKSILECKMKNKLV